MSFACAFERDFLLNVGSYDERDCISAWTFAFPRRTKTCTTQMVLTVTHAPFLLLTLSTSEKRVEEKVPTSQRANKTLPTITILCWRGALSARSDEEHDSEEGATF